MVNQKKIATEWEGAPEPVCELGPEGKKLWDLLIEYMPPSVVAAADSPALTALCRVWDKYMYFDALIDETSDPKAKWKYFCMGTAYLNHFNNISKRFGLSPYDRSKITPKGTGKAKEKDPLDSLVAQMTNFDRN